MICRKEEWRDLPGYYDLPQEPDFDLAPVLWWAEAPLVAGGGVLRTPTTFERNVTV